MSPLLEKQWQFYLSICIYVQNYLLFQVQHQFSAQFNEHAHGAYEDISKVVDCCTGKFRCPKYEDNRLENFYFLLAEKY